MLIVNPVFVLTKALTVPESVFSAKYISQHSWLENISCCFKLGMLIKTASDQSSEKTSLVLSGAD